LWSRRAELRRATMPANVGADALWNVNTSDSGDRDFELPSSTDKNVFTLIHHVKSSCLC